MGWGQAPPHTRGSTRFITKLHYYKLGSPAHAGIDLPGFPKRLARRRLPRTRGDRPLTGPDGGSWNEAPPHTRGSTVSVQEFFHAAMGSPAHAGIDLRPRSRHSPIARLPRTRGDRPATILPSCSHIGLPRTRGDRPQGRRARQLIKSAPPHTRGSTWIAGRALIVGRGSPAHAGIDPYRDAMAARGAWLPRTRGDRPPCAPCWTWRIMAPPHTRGSTPDSGTPCRRWRGSPAHAGIDLCFRSPAARCSRLPRTRGDRPYLRWPYFYDRWAPPHTRGSTRPRGML